MITLISFSMLIVGALLLARHVRPANFETGVIHAG